MRAWLSHRFQELGLREDVCEHVRRLYDVGEGGRAEVANIFGKVQAGKVLNNLDGYVYSGCTRALLRLCPKAF